MGNYLANVSKLLVPVQNVESIINFLGRKFVINDRRYYVSTDVTPPFSVIEEEPSRLFVEKVKPTYLVLSDGSFAKCLIAYDFQNVEPGFIESSIWHEVLLMFVSASNEHSRLYSMFRHLKKQYGAGTITGSAESMLERFNDIAESLGKGSKLLRFLVTFIVRADSLNELNSKCKAYLVS